MTLTAPADGEAPSHPLATQRGDVALAPDLQALIDDLPPELRRLHGRPFGRDESGEAIAHGSGRLVASSVGYIRSLIGARAEREVAAGTDLLERRAIVERAQDAAVEQLVAMLNAATPDDRYHVTAAYLLNEGNNYSYEFRLFVAEYGARITGDADFAFNLGRRSIPGSIVLMARPIGIRGTYNVLPRFTAKYVRTDLRVAGTTKNSAVIQWYGSSQLDHVPAVLHHRYVAYACAAYRGTFAAIPTLIADQPMARVAQRLCQLDGADHCEWEFEWDRPAATRSAVALAAGVGGSLLTLAYLALRLPGWEAIAVVLATLLPAGLVLYGGDARRRARELNTQQQLLLEQRDQTEREYDRSERANADLQQSNLELEQHVAELMTINEVSVATSTTLDLDEVLDRSLQAVVGHLRFDRALVLLADERRGVLTGGRTAGATPGMQALVAELELPLDHRESQLAGLYRADGPMLFRDIDQDPHEPNRQLALALGVTSFLGTPLVTKGRSVGVLAVDNRLTGRDVEARDGPLLFTVGSLIASAIDNARLYAEIETQNRALEDRVEQRTDQLRRATAEAHEARAAAEAASETKSEFLANVSHELRTPLTSVVGFTKIVQKRLDEIVLPTVPPGDPKVERAVRQVRGNLEIMAAEGDRLTAMINDVLDLAKIEAGKLEWRSEAVAIGEVLDRAMAATASLFESTGLQLIRDIEPDLPPVTGDRDRLIQVAINLLSNAVKFTPSGSVTVRAARAGGEIVVAVSDTGVGIAPEHHGRVFEQFLQAGDTLTDKPRGTGLGLPISRQIVDHHGGRLWLESAPGEGSTFLFSLPIAAATATSPRPSMLEPSRRDGRPDREARATVVLIEDDAPTRALVRQAVEPLGIRLLEASTGDVGLRLVRDSGAELAILDVVLPDGDGLDIARRLRADPATAHIRLLTATVLDDSEAAARAGVDRHVTKPFDAEELAAAVSELLMDGPRPT